jgi:hypothetical protein
MKGKGMTLDPEGSKRKRAANRHRSAALLQSRGFKFEERNGGAHLIVTHGDVVADLWPGTGKFKLRGASEYGRGVFNLIRELKGAKS